MPGIIGPGGPGIVQMMKEQKAKDAADKAAKAAKQRTINAAPAKVTKSVTDTFKAAGSPAAGGPGGRYSTAPKKANDQTDPQTGATTTQKQRVMAIQRILVNHGYKVNVDGVAGDQTNSALKDFHSSAPNSKAWNGGHGGDGTAKAVNPANTGTFTSGGKTVTAGPDDTPTGTTSVSQQTGFTLPKGIDPKNWEVNAGKLAQSQVNTEYNPQISTENQTIGDSTRQAASNLAMLKAGYGNAGAVAAAGAKQVAGADQEAVGDHNSATQAILNALGGGASAAAASVGRQAQSGGDFLATAGANHSELNDMLSGLIANQGASAEANQNNKDQSGIADLKGTLLGLIKAKASALVGAQATDKQQNLSNLLNITQSNNSTQADAVNQALSEAYLPTKIATASATAGKNARAAVPKSFFVNATGSDITSAKAAVVAALKAGGGKLTPQQQATIAANTIPWKVSTPGVYQRVIAPALSLAGVNGVTPAMLGMTG